MTLLLHIADRVLNRPLLVHPDKLPIVLSVLEGRLPIGPLPVSGSSDLPSEAMAVLTGPSPSASRFVGEVADTDPQTGVKTALPYRREGGVAIVSVIGSLVNRGAWLGSYSGETSYEGVKYQIGKAAADPRAHAILLDIESPGGEAVGAFEVAAAVRAAAALKPVVAVVNGMAASAAYAIASGATKIVTTATGMSGSIGVVLLHADYSRQIDKAGVTPTLIFAGAHKVDGNALQPLSDEVKSDLQREVDGFYDLFVETVATGRRNLSAAAIRGTEARTYIGAAAVAEGLADEVGTFESALAELVSRAPKGRASMSNRKGANMDNKEGAPAADAGITQAHLDTAVAAARNDGLAAGAKAERERILGIDALGAVGHDGLIAAFRSDGKTSPEAAAMQIMQAEKATRESRLNGLAAADGKMKIPVAGTANPAPDAGRTDAKPTATTPDGWKAEYAASADLQAEYPSAEAYVAFQRRASLRVA